MLKKKTKTMVALLVGAILCVNSIFALWTANATEVLASDAMKVEDVTYEMKYGASVRYATTAEESGLRFAATMPKEEYEAILSSGYAELTFGMLIMPYNYIEKYGAFTEENVFGTNAVYDWATLNEDGNWIYSGNKVQIINITSDKLTTDKDDNSLCVMNGSIMGILEPNLARDFVGLGYIQYKVNESDAYSYRFAEYADDALHNNVRSIVEVAEAVYESADASTDNKSLVKEYYIDATDQRCVKFFDGNELLEIHKSFTEYYFDGVPLAETEEGYEFAYWVDKNGKEVVIEKDTTQVTKTMKLYSVYKKGSLDYVAEGYLGTNGKIMTAINEFIAMDVTKANVASAQAKYNEIVEYLEVPRATEYNALVGEETRTAINDKVTEINAVLEDADDLYETYSEVISEATSTSCAQDVVTTIPFPCVNYSLLQSVSFDWSTTGWTFAGYGEDLWYYNSGTTLSGTATIINNGDGTLTVTMTESQNSLGTHSVTITDADIVNGKTPVAFAAKSLVNTQTFQLGAITVTSLYDFTSVEDSVVLYTGQDLIDNTSVTNASGGVPFLESASSLIADGVNYDCSGTGATDWTVTLPKIAYASYDTVTMSFQATNNWQTFGFVEGDRIADDGDSAMTGTITFTNKGNTVDVVISEAVKGSISYTITDAEVLNGTKAFTLFWNQGDVFRQMSFGPISATMSLNGRLEAAAENGKTPKLVESTLYTGQDLIDKMSVTDGSGNKPQIIGASTLIDGGVNYDCSDTNATDWTVTLPKIAYASYDTVTMSFQATNEWQTFGFVEGDRIADGGDSAMTGTITFTNKGNTVDVVISEAVKGSISYTITDKNVLNGTEAFTLFWNQGAQYRQLSFGPIIGMSRVSAEGVEKINVADREVSLKMPYYNVASEIVNYGQEYAFENANDGNNRYAELPLVNYSLYERIEFNIESSPYTLIGHNNGWYYNACVMKGTVTIINRGNCLEITKTITEGASGTDTITIDDAEIMNGTKPLSFTLLIWDNSKQTFSVGTITGYGRQGRVTTSPSATPYTIADFSKSTYEVNAVVTNDTEDPNGERDILVRRDLNGTGLLEIQTQNSSSTNTYNYAVELPWIPYNKYVSVSTTITSNNGMAGVDETLAFLDTKDDGQELKMSYANGMLTVSLGGQVSTTCTDADVLNGRKGLTIYMQGSQYTSSYLSAFTAIGKVAPTSSGTREQALDLDAKSGSTNVSAYRIAYDANGAYNDGDYYKWIANEMKLFLEEMTGETFLTVGVHDPSVIKNTSKYIVIGERLAQENGVENFDLTQTNGYNVKQDYKNLYIYGGTPRGTMSGVYGFLKDMAGLTFYTDDVYTFYYEDLHVASGYATAFNPSFNIGITGYAEAQYSKEYHNRLGLSNDGYIGAGAKEDADGNGVKETIGTHCMLDILPYETYGSQYKGWYVKDDGGDWQLDFTNDDRDAMLELVVASMKEAIEAFPDHDYFVFGQPDSMYGPDVAEYLDFMNDCSEAIDTWLKEENPTRTVSLCMFAYNGTLEAPTTGSFYNGECASTAVIFAPVGARYTDTFANSYHKDTDEGEWVNTKTIQKYLDEWKALDGANIHFWLYGTDYYNYMMPMNTITNMQANYQAAYKAGTDAIHYQFQTGAQSSVGSDWQRLKTYLSAELTKDVEANVATLQDNFMNAMYGAGAESMKTLLAAQQEYVTYDNFNEKDNIFIGINNTEYYFGVINGSNKLLSTSYFDETTLKAWMGYIDAARKAINNDTTLSNAKKQVLLDNVDVEALSIRYMLIELHDDTTYDASLDAWETAAKALGCTALNEGTNF